MALPAWALSLIVKLAIPFVVRQLEKWADQIDFEKVKKDFADRIRSLVPGTLFDDAAVQVSDTIIDKIAAVLTATGALETVLKLLASGDLKAAFEALKDALLSKLAPELELASLTADEKDAKLAEVLA